MKTVNMHEAKTQLSALVRDLRAGNESEIVIALAGEPAAKLVPVGKPAPRQLGIDRGLITIAPDFDAVDAQIANLFEGD
jgi:antitoxin (DNA-binding transcriptional repressor) of toxin-antitoxin stability system